MPEYTGGTDERHVFPLPSAIESVHWTRRQAAPGGTVGLDVRTQFCADGSHLQIQLTDAQGTVHDTLSGPLHDNHASIGLSVPPTAKGGLVATVKLPSHGLSAESPALQLTGPVRIRDPRWSIEAARRGEAVTLTAEARGAPDGRRALLRIFERDPQMGAHDPVATLRPRVEDEAIEVEWQVELPGDPDDIPPEWDAPEGYTQPELFYEVDVSGLRAASKDEKRKGKLTVRDDLELELLDADSHAPLTEQTVKVTLPDGSTQKKSLTAEGRLSLEKIPPGPVRVQLPEYTPPTEDGGATGPDGDAGGIPDGATTLVMESAETSVTVAPGGPETIYVVPPRIDVYLDHGLPGQALEGTEYELTVKTKEGSKSTFEGTLGDDGRLRQAVPLGAVAAVLTLTGDAGNLVVPIDLTGLSEASETTGLQQRLAQLGFYDGKVDEKDGPVTRAAIRSLQEQLGMPAVGILSEGDRSIIEGMRFRNT
jgi:hypothetical protein